MFKKVKKPEIEKWWTTIYFGPRGSGKTLHQAKEVIKIFKYLDDLYLRKPDLKRAIIFSVQKFSHSVEEKYLNNLLYYWNDAKELRYCPRKICWKTPKRHRLHGAYLIIDDISTILPPDKWQYTPVWLRKTFLQGRHFGIRVLANLQDPFACDVNFRRCVDMAFRFRKLLGSSDPDETKPIIKRIWGIYQRRRIKAELLWKFGDMSDDEIILMKEKQKQEAEIRGTYLFRDIWRGSLHWISRKICEIYDTTQDVPEYRPTGYAHLELFCVDPAHNHTDKDDPTFCGFKKVSHEII
jgi:hypothetical protein